MEQSIGIVLGLAFWAIVVLIIAKGVKSNNKRKQTVEKMNIPKGSKVIRCYNDTGDRIGKIMYSWNNESSLFFLDPKTSNREQVNKDDILNFTLIGDFHTETDVSGGGASIGGAVVGAAVAGPVGAVIGGRKKVKTKHKTIDTRKVILKFKESEKEKGMIFDMSLFDTLCFMCPEKKIS